MDVNTATGSFLLASGFRLGADTSKAEFLASPEGLVAKPLVRNPPHENFQFKAADGYLSVCVFFSGPQLQSVHLAVLAPELATEWSERNERARVVENDRWLHSQGLEPGRAYPWGSVWSGYDPKGCSGQVVVRYSLSS